MPENDRVFESLEALLSVANGRACCAVIGNPITHSLSPRIHAEFGRQCQESFFYGKFQAESASFRDTVTAFFNRGGRGLNVTVPFKETAFLQCDCLTERAKTAGAVNTIWREASKLWGDNTDGHGLVIDLTNRCGVTLSGARVLILGAGGAVRGVLAPLLATEVAQIAISNRTPQKAIELVNDFSKLDAFQSGALRIEDDNASPVAPYDVVINGTGAGLSGQVPKLNSRWFGPKTVVYDMMYAPLSCAATDTAFLSYVVSNYGLTSCWDGLGMLVEQAAVAFSRWFDKQPDTAAVLRLLGR